LVDAFALRKPVPSSLENALGTLTKTGRGLIAAPMINAATIVIVRRRRTIAVRADICV
jgi:hypothetical protein